MDEKFFGELGNITLNTLEQATRTTELFRLKNELSELMCRHMADCADIIKQMEHLLEEIKRVEQLSVEQTKLAMEQDLKEK